MKKLLPILMMAVLALSSSLKAFAVPSEDVLTYEILSDSLKTCGVLTCDSTASGEIAIPSYAVIDNENYKVVSILEDAFYNNKQITKVTIPSTVKEIGEDSFCQMDSLQIVSFGDSLVSIGKQAFCYCTKLENAILPSTVKEIDESAFAQAYSLKAISLGQSLTKIGNEAFRYCEELDNVVIPDSVTEIGESTFAMAYNLKKVSLGQSIKKIGYEAFYYCEKLDNMIIPDSVTEIGNEAFYCCSALQNLIFGKGLKRIGRNAFQSISAKIIEIPDNVEEICDSAFVNCDNMKTCVVGDGVITIGDGVFADANEMTSLTLGSALKTIGSAAFNDCAANSGELTITCRNPQPPTCADDSFDSYIYEIATLIVPDGSLQAYQEAPVWKNFMNINEDGHVEVDSIIDTKDNNQDIFGLNGQKLTHPESGINIINGKKVLIKD